jgi:surface antigen
MYIGCQCAHLYRAGSKMDKEGSVVPCKDYRVSTYTKDCQNHSHGKKGINGSHHHTTTDR